MPLKNSADGLFQRCLVHIFKLQYKIHIEGLRAKRKKAQVFFFLLMKNIARQGFINNGHLVNAAAEAVAGFLYVSYQCLFIVFYLLQQLAGIGACRNAQFKLVVDDGDPDVGSPDLVD